MTQVLPPGAGPDPRDGSGSAADRADVAVVSPRRLMWRRFRKHRLAMAGLIVTLAIYAVAVFADFLAPYSSAHYSADYALAPPQMVQVADWGLHVNGYTSTQDSDSLALTWEVDDTQKIDIGLFVAGEPYKLFGVIPTDIHLIGPTDPDGPPMYLLGADELGHDLLSRIIHGARVSMSIGLAGVAVAFVLGVLLGGVSGYFGGRTDTVIQRIVEFLMSLPSLPLWLGLAAAIPLDWGPLRRYFLITVILSIIGWTDLARVVRGKFLSLREESFVTVARLDGASRRRIIFRHMLPSFTSHLIASLTLSIPAMILAETALSFLGLGLQPPVVSWGVLLQEAQSIRAVSTAPWLLLPGLAVIVAVLALNFLGDGLRDAADPYKH